MGYLASIFARIEAKCGFYPSVEATTEAKCGFLFQMIFLF